MGLEGGGGEKGGFWREVIKEGCGESAVQK